jgi:hypothetical protein
LTSLGSLAQVGKSAACTPGCCLPVSPISGFRSQGTYGAHKFPENPIVPLPCSWTPVEPRCLAFAALRCCPPSAEGEGPRRPWSFRSSITRPQHWLFTLRAAITDDDAKLASGGWPLFPGWDSSSPTEFCREVSAFRLSLPLGFACRDLLSPVKSRSPYGETSRKNTLLCVGSIVTEMVMALMSIPVALPPVTRQPIASESKIVVSGVAPVTVAIVDNKVPFVSPPV